MRSCGANLLDVLNTEYVKVACAKGLSGRTVIWKHALRNAVQPLVMSIGMALPWLIQGEIATSIVLGLPTTDPCCCALQTQDIPSRLISFLISCLMVICNFLADVALCLVDPRVRG